MAIFSPVVQRLIAYAAAAAFVFCAGWQANGWRLSREIAEMKSQHSEAQTRASAAALHAYTSMEKTKNDAIKAALLRSEQDQADAMATAAAADRLRKQLAAVPSSIAAASRAAVDEYAATAGELLGACTAEYQSVAAAADQHRADAQMMRDAWPRNPTE